MWDQGLVDTDRVGFSYIYLHLTTCGTWDLLMQTELVIAIFTYIKQLVGYGTELVIATVRFIKYFYIYLQGCGTRDLLDKTL